MKAYPLLGVRALLAIRLGPVKTLLKSWVPAMFLSLHKEWVDKGSDDIVTTSGQVEI